MARAKNSDISVERAFRELISQEVASQLRPLQEAVSRLELSAANLAGLNVLAQQLAPFTALFGPQAQAPVPRRGRPPAGAAPQKAAASSGGRDCGVGGCGKQARSKGYCPAHYQKLRLLTRRGRRPASWVDFPAPGTVEDLVLPRGRAAAPSA